MMAKPASPPRDTTPTTNQTQLKSLIASRNYTQAQVAQLLSEHTGRPCSLRSVQAWLADPALPSARPCPEWAIRVLLQTTS